MTMANTRLKGTMLKYKKPSVKVISYTALHPDLAFDVDYLPVLAARVSHNQDDKTGKDEDKDKKLMEYLASHKHFSPFEHQSVTFLIECPFFVAREWHRHRTQAFNEISARYSSDFIGQFWMPKVFRKQETRNKQSSAGELENSYKAQEILHAFYEQSMDAYDALIELGVAREMARAVLPMGHLTRFYASANIRNWKHFCDLRISPDAQQEIRELAQVVSDELNNLYPNTWKALNNVTA